MKARHTATLGPFMTSPEVARYLQIGISALRKLVRGGQISALKIDTNYRFSKDAIKELIIDREGNPNQLEMRTGQRPDVFPTLREVT